MEGVGGCPKFIVLSTGPLSVPNYYTKVTPDWICAIFAPSQ